MRNSWLCERFKYAASLWLAVLREIFDESAYVRYLARHQMRSSAKVYAAFLRERAALDSRRQRCC
ncbi:MAG: hypothetical protein JO249_23485 [Acidobacteria bacterium]|nr:hypothetical protein [Acidobacteriota bacterium]